MENTRDFPLDVFFDKTRNLVHLFFRQGMAYIIKVNEVKKVYQQNISDWDIGSTWFHNNEILLVKSSTQIFMFRLEEEKDKLISAVQKPLKWVKFHELDIEAFIVSQHGSELVQLVDDHHIYYYSFDEKDQMPQLKMVMQNYMGCTSLGMDNNDKICVTYKSGQPDFQCYLRKYDHGFREIVNPESREGVCAVNVPSRNVFIVSDDDYLNIHDQNTYKRLVKYDIDL